MNINCQFNPADNTVNCDYPFLQTYIADNNQNYFVSSLWTGADLLTSFLLIVIIMLMIGDKFFNFFLSPVNKIKRKYD